MKDLALVTNASGAWPDVIAQNESVPGAKDGTALEASWLTDLFGFFQAILHEVGEAPDATDELHDSSQLFEALVMRLSTPGEVVGYPSATIPASARLIKLEGQCATVGTYPRLLHVYCGDPENPTAPAYYRCTDPLNPSTSRNVAGGYIKLPDYRGLFLRGRDGAANHDPDGLTREFGDVQSFMLQDHTHDGIKYGANAYTGNAYPYGATSSKRFLTEEAGGHAVRTGTVTPSANEGRETRPVNAILTWCIRY